MHLCTGTGVLYRPYGLCTAYRGSKVIALLFLTTALEGGEESASRPGRSLPPGKTPVPIVQEAGWVPRPVWTGEENFAPPAFDPRTVQPVASRYTDYVTLPFVLFYLYMISVLCLLRYCRCLFVYVNLKFV